MRTRIAHPNGYPKTDCPSTEMATDGLVSLLSRRGRNLVFYIIIFGGLAIVLVAAFFMKWNQRNNWPDDE